MEVLHIHYSVQETECCKVPRDLWVIAQRELTLDYGGSVKSPLHFLILCPNPFMSPLPRPVPLHRQTATTHRTRDCITAVLRSDGRWWVYFVRLQTEWQTVSGLSCVAAALDHGQPWLVEKGFCLSYGPPGTAVQFMRKAERRMWQEVGEVVWPADNTWRETDRFDMRTCPHLCLGKRKPQTASADWVSKYSYSAIRQNSSNAPKPVSFPMCRPREFCCYSL